MAKVTGAVDSVPVYRGLSIKYSGFQLWTAGHFVELSYNVRHPFPQNLRRVHDVKYPFASSLQVKLEFLKAVPRIWT